MKPAEAQAMSRDGIACRWNGDGSVVYLYPDDTAKWRVRGDTLFPLTLDDTAVANHDDWMPRYNTAGASEGPIWDILRANVQAAEAQHPGRLITLKTLRDMLIKPHI
jgi:hypothetical protein